MMPLCFSVPVPVWGFAVESSDYTGPRPLHPAQLPGKNTHNSVYCERKYVHMFLFLKATAYVHEYKHTVRSISGTVDKTANC